MESVKKLGIGDGYEKIPATGLIILLRPFE